MNRIAVFPITHELLSLLSYKELIKGFKIKAINSFKEDTLLERIQLENPECIVTSDIDETLEHVDIVVLLDNAEGFILDKYKKVFFEAQKLNKKILLSSKLKQQISIPDNKNVELLTNSFSKEKNERRLFKNISVPTIAICGMGENCSKFETLLLTLNVLKKKDYRVVPLSGNPLITLFGGYTLPEYLYADDISLEQKIYRLNYDLYQLSKKVETDVFLIEIPGGIMPLMGHEKNHFSEIPLVISNAVDIDIGILNMYVPFQKNDEGPVFWKEYCDYKYGIPIEVLCMARQKAVYNREKFSYNFMYLDEEYYDKLYCKYCTSDIIQLTKQEQAEARLNEAIYSLENNVEFI